MPLSGTLTKANLIDAVAERNGFNRNKSIEAIEILLELIKQSLESGHWQGHDPEIPEGCHISMLVEAEGEE